MCADALTARRRFAPHGIRARTTLSAVVVVGVALAIAALALVSAARSALGAQIEDSARMRAQDVAALVHAGTLPSPIAGRDESLLVQVLDRSGRVTASSASIEGQAPLVAASSLTRVDRTFRVATLQDGGYDRAGGDAGSGTPPRYAVALSSAETSRGTSTVLVAASLAPVDQLSAVLVPLLAGGLPLVMLVIGAAVWMLTGRALRPVESITAEADSISASALDRRVPVPASRDEVAHLAQTMNRMLDRLESAAVRQRQFVANASHELKSPVAAILTMLDVAGADGRRVELTTLLRDLRAEDERLAALVADLLTLASSDEGQLRLRPADVDLDDAVLIEVAAMRSTTGVDFDTRGVRPARISADPDKLAQLLRNLLDNAARHADSRVCAATWIDGGEAVLVVADDGPGIAPEQRERVFERFVRLDEARGRSDGGTGLGLSVCRAIARAHGGDIRLIDAEGGGAAFEVRLPVSAEKG
jgi:signal transduction histidine kinase